MRSSVLFTAAFAAAALAGPVFDKRGEIVVTDNEVVYVTQLVTVTEGQAAPTEVPSAAPTGYTPWWKKGRGRGRKSRTRTGYGTAPAPTQPAPVPTTQAPAPVPSSYEPEPQPEPTTEAPAPAPTSYEQPEPAPTSYEQPAPAPPSSSAAAPAPTGYNPVSIDNQAPLHIQPEIVHIETPAPALAPKSPVLHKFLPIPLSIFGFSTPGCHEEEVVPEVHLMKRGDKVAVKQKNAKVNKKQKKTTTTKQKKAKATKAPKVTTPKTTPAKDTSAKETPSKDTSSKDTASSSTSKGVATKTSSKPSTGVATTYKQAVVNHHNYHRANHSSPDLTWSAALAQTAKKIADTCVYAHSMDVDGGDYGAKDISKIISDMFYNSEIGYFSSQYGKASPDMSNFSKWGHASQIVWKATTEVGCYTTDCTGSGLQNFNYKSNAYYTVCNYKVAGNMVGAFDDNVGTCLNQPTIDGTYNVDTEAIGAGSIL
ncbi:Hypothetical protein D9617_5g068540 [Elsinoe fawcettii]|nr:Hypothetical protein D9617_5g068540 [Elsinoe fawcettii]